MKTLVKKLRQLVCRHNYDYAYHNDLTAYLICTKCGKTLHDRDAFFRKRNNHKKDKPMIEMNNSTLKIILDFVFQILAIVTTLFVCLIMADAIKQLAVSIAQ